MTGLYVDPAGMLSPSYAHWSIEIWVVAGNTVYRPADDWARVRHDRDVKNSIITTVWDSALFKLQQTVYGARSAVDEAVIEIECLLKERKNSSLLVSVRPYDQFHLGGLDSVEFHADSLALTVNGKKTICVGARPDYVLSGGGDRCRDIDPRDDGKQFRSASKYGMAALGLGYSLKKGENGCGSGSPSIRAAAWPAASMITTRSGRTTPPSRASGSGTAPTLSFPTS